MRDPRVFVLLALGGLLALGILAWLRPEKHVSPPLAETALRGDSIGAGIAESAPLAGEPGANTEAPGTDGAQPDSPREPLGRETSTLVGRLLQSAAPLPGIRVELWRRTTTPPRQYERSQSEQTDRSGAFAFQGMDHTATHELRMDGPGIPFEYKIERIMFGADPMRDLGDIEVPLPSSLTGRLVEEGGRPIPGILIFHTQGITGALHFNRSQEHTEGSHGTVTDSEGRFLLEGVLPGYNYLLVEDPEYADRTLSQDVNPGQVHDFGDVIVQRGKQIQGRVVGPDGNTVAGAFVAPEGGRNDTILVRKGTRTDNEGRFRLKGIGNDVDSVAVRAEGFQELHLPKKEWTEPLLLQLQDVLVLTGRIEGHDGRPAHVTLDTAMDSGWIPPRWAYRLLMAPHSVAEDGSFQIAGLAEGTYTIVAEAEGYGTTEEQVIRVSRTMDPVVLTITPSRRIGVVVRDDQGKAIEGAEVVMDLGVSRYRSLYDGSPVANTRRILGNGRFKIRENTDADGRTELLQGPRLPIALGAQHPDHVSASVIHEAGAWPDPIEIILHRAGRITGRLTDPTGGDQFRIGVSIVRAGIDLTKATSEDSFSAGIDGEGRFEVAQVPPGTYDIAVTRTNATRSDDPATRLLRATPLLGGGQDDRTLQRIETRPGETTEVILDVQPLGRIEGRVFHADRPAAGAIVFAVHPGTSSRMNFFSRSTGTPNWDKPDSHEWDPFTITKKDGSFLFLYATPATWEFRTRHPDSPVPAPPVLVRATDHGQAIQQDLHLGTATIRGQLDTDSLTEERKKSLTAYLFRLDRSHTDPFYSPHHGTSQSWEMMRLEMDTSGAFEFPYLPEGDWVLRLVSRWDDIVVQRLLHTNRNLPIDLGTLKPPKTVDAKVQIVLSKTDSGSQDPFLRQSFGLWIRKPIAGREQGIFVRTVRVSEGAVELGALEPGDYEVDLFGGYSGMSIGLSGKSLGEIRRLTVKEDGTVEPASLEY